MNHLYDRIFFIPFILSIIVYDFSDPMLSLLLKNELVIMAHL